MHIFILTFITVTRKTFSFQVTMHSLQGCFFALFIEGNMTGSLSANYYAKSLKRNKFQSHNIRKLFKRPRSENNANETHEIENIQDEQQREQEAIVEQLEEDHSTVVTEAPSSSSINPRPQVFVAVCTTKPTNTVSTKIDLTKIERFSCESPDFYYCPVGKGWYYKVCVNFAGVNAPNIPCISIAGFFTDHKTRNSTIHSNYFKK